MDNDALRCVEQSRAEGRCEAARGEEVRGAEQRCAELNGNYMPHSVTRAIAEFPRVWPMLDASLASFGRTHREDQVFEIIRNGRAHMWSSEHAVILAQLITFPIGIRCAVVWLQGGNLTELLPMHPAIEQWARENGCDRLVAWGRRGWLRALDGWRDCGARRSKWLTDVPDHLRETK